MIENMTDDKIKRVLIDEQRGFGLIATVAIKKGEIVTNQTPLASACLSCKDENLYCNHCMRSLENLEGNIRRLTQWPDYQLSESAKFEDLNFTSATVSCNLCGVLYCSETCRETAKNVYHQVLCLGSERHDPTKPANQLRKIWCEFIKSVNMMENFSTDLILRIAATFKQSSNKSKLLQKYRLLCSSNNKEENCMIVESILGPNYLKLISQMLDLFRQSVYEEFISDWYLLDGFMELLALLSRNEEDIIDIAPYRRWERAALKGEISVELRDETARLKLRTKHLKNYKDFAASGLYPVPYSSTNHSCVPNCTPFNEDCHIVSLVALKDIEVGEELRISYLLHGEDRWPYAQRNDFIWQRYAFRCVCPRCTTEKNAKQQ